MTQKGLKNVEQAQRLFMTYYLNLDQEIKKTRFKEG